MLRTQLPRAEQRPTELLAQPGDFDGFRVGQKVADANDLPRSKVKDFPDFLAELDAGRPGGQVDMTEDEDRLAEVAELLGPIGEASPRLTAVLPPDLSRAVMTSVGGCLSLEARLDRRLPLEVGSELGQKGVQIICIPSLDGALDGIHILLRHRRPSIPRASALRATQQRLGRCLFEAGVCRSQIETPAITVAHGRDGSRRGRRPPQPGQGAGVGLPRDCL